MEEWEEETEGPGARTQKYIAGSVVDSFVYDASGFSVVASMSHYRDEGRVAYQSNPLT